MKKYFSEAIGTFALILFGTGAIVINDISGGVITHLGICLVFGLVVMVMIEVLGAYSGAHMNPAVSLGFWLSGKISGGHFVGYTLSQVLGAVAASALLKVEFSQHPNLGATLPHSISPSVAFVIEILLAFFLMLVIFSVSDADRKGGISASVVIGAMITLEALVAGPITGASMNPARSLAPAICSGHLEFLWIYLTAPFIGVGLALLCQRGMRSKTS